MFLHTMLQILPLPRLSRYAAVLAVAMAAGHLAQTLAAHKGGLASVARADVMPTHIVQLSADREPDAVAIPDPEPHLLALENAVPACLVDLTLKALPQAMLSVALAAPCHDGERVVLHQAGLAVTGRVVQGKLAVTLPALTADGVVKVLFADGARVEQALPMPQVTGLRRFGVQWQGAEAFMLHGMENGADFGQPGDVSVKSPAGAGYLTILGDATVENPLLAQVYTYPADPGVNPAIVLEAAVLPETCGHDLLGDVLTSQGGQAQSIDLTLAMPDCSGVGDFLVLKNLASDMKIAAN